MKKKIVILGTGFGGFGVLKNLNLDHYEVIVVSERNHFLFTPLLPSTTVGTIEFRSIIEPIRHIGDRITFYQASAVSLDIQKKSVICQNITDDRKFEIQFNFLVIAVGAVNNTFGVPGVHEHAFFLKELHDARRIRQRIIDNFELANIPKLETYEIRRLLHFVVVGGGPTGVEFAAEMADFLEEDLVKAYPKLVGSVRITLIEASKHILGTYDAKISEYATKLFNRRRVEILTDRPVKIVMEKSLVLTDGTEIDFGLLVWSTGNAQAPFVESLSFEKDRSGRILTNDYFQVKNNSDIFAIGDSANIEGKNMVATAQTANQEGKYLGRLFNKLAEEAEIAKLPKFKFKNLGMLAYVGDNRAVADLPTGKGRGLSTWLFWRSAYLTKLVSLKNKVLVLFDWAKTAVFGRDISRF